MTKLAQSLSSKGDLSQKLNTYATTIEVENDSPEGLARMPEDC